MLKASRYATAIKIVTAWNRHAAIGSRNYYVYFANLKISAQKSLAVKLLKAL